jgi:ribonuclease HII
MRLGRLSSVILLRHTTHNTVASSKRVSFAPLSGFHRHHHQNTRAFLGLRIKNSCFSTSAMNKKPIKPDPKQRGMGMFLQRGVNIATQAKGEGTTTPPKKTISAETTTLKVSSLPKRIEGEDKEDQEGAQKRKTNKTSKKETTKTTPSRQSARKREKPEKLDVSSPKKKPKAAGPTKYHENSRREKGYKRVCGVDEAGRGPLAGPVIAAACILPEGVQIEGVDDSKKINSEEERELLYEAIMEDKRIETAYWICDEKRIDQINILEATMECMRKSTEMLPGGPVDWALIDGNKIPKGLEDKAEAIVKGDAKSQCIATASIVAKVTRDRMMREIDTKYPQYGFKDHKGYGTKAHCQAIEKYGPCEYHRMTFAPIKYMDLSKYE